MRKILDALSREPDLKLRISEPPSINKAYATVSDKQRKAFNFKLRGKRKTDAYKSWLSIIGPELPDRLLKKFTEKVAVAYFVPRKILKSGKFGKKDCGNYEKVMSDYLVARGVIVDDSLIEINMQSWSEDDKFHVHIWDL